MLKTGDILEDKYRIIDFLGKGAWGCVYLAENVKIGNLWAIKEIDLAKDTRVDLLAEPEILKKLNHPSLPRIVDIVKTGECLYIIEDYFEGTNLKQLIRSREVCTEENVVEWAIQLCEILQYLHSFSPPLIYRDMKPGNVIIDKENKVKLVDFGITREYRYGHDSDSTFVGTRGYAAPEQFYAGRQSDERTDIYGLGATLYHVLTGVSPNDPPYEMVPVRETNKNLSKDIERIITTCTQSDPELRYHSVDELLEELGRLKSKLKRNSPLGSLLSNISTAPQREVVVEKIVGTVTIAVGGTNRGVGSTYMAIAIADFLNRMKCKVAVVEQNEHPAFFALEDEDCSRGQLPDAFRINGIDFYKQNSSLVDVLRVGYNYVIVDLGQLIKTDEAGLIIKNIWYDEMSRASLSVLVSGAALWQLKDLASYLKERDTDTWRLVLRTPETGLFKQLKDEVKFDSFAMPFCPDPMKADAAAETALAEILSPVLPREKKKSKLLFWK